ncbi:hypothetical protein J8273_7107 [Carpediemonas membranifera]|uniref:Uncharacterized protein n=1 Tax=Carpediemonas membranifera TaxID=201153 RepID=A0A8J6DZK4_9EUKA|nr:hypothetical protein J8273_7107 [Carpediemonas membranifera]|eukprot:KAG9390848.1 hypothetical protein J8273_7107 [Carpediemonas membranifera]
MNHLERQSRKKCATLRQYLNGLVKQSNFETKMIKDRGEMLRSLQSFQKQLVQTARFVEDETGMDFYLHPMFKDGCQNPLLTQGLIPFLLDSKTSPAVTYDEQRSLEELKQVTRAFNIQGQDPGEAFDYIKPILESYNAFIDNVVRAVQSSVAEPRQRTAYFADQRRYAKNHVTGRLQGLPSAPRRTGGGTVPCFF